MSFRSLLFTGAVALLALQACSSDQSVDPGSTTVPEGGASFQVNYQSQSVDLDLSALAKTDYKGAGLVKLADVWTASKIAADRTTLEFEFVASDGFKPSNKANCGDLPGTVLDKGYIDPLSRKLIWDETIGLAGCYAVKNTIKMNAHEPTDAGVALDGAADSPAE
jgi:hypothetical protein